MKKLNARERLFIKHYLVLRNATQAAIKAGYSQKTAAVKASQLLSKVNISEAIEAGIQGLEKKLDITAERIAEELAKIGFSDMRRIAKWGHNSVEFIPFDSLDDASAAAISEISESTTEYGQNLKVRLHDKTKALELLGKWRKMFTDKHEHTGPDGKPLVTSFVELVKLAESHKKKEGKK